MAVQADLDIKIGDTFWSQKWAILVGRVPVDLSTGGWIVRAQIRPRPGSPVVLYEFSDEVSVHITPPQAAEDPDEVVPSLVQLHIPAEQAATLTEWVGAWDLEIENPTFDSGSVFRETVLEGVARTTWDVTRS